MQDKELKELVHNVLIDKDGYEFIKVLLEELGAFERGVNLQSRDNDLFNRGKREKGLWLLDLVQKSNFDKYVEIMKERLNDVR